MFAVKLANFLMFTVSGENTFKCLESFSRKTHCLRKSVIKSLKNFEPVLKGAVVSFFDPCATVFWETWEVLGTNLIQRARDPLVSVDSEVETSWRNL